MMSYFIIAALASALAASLWQWRKEKRSATTARRSMLKAREQRDTAQLKAQRATASLREIRPLLELPENATIFRFSYDVEAKPEEKFHIALKINRRFIGIGWGNSWKAATGEALRDALQLEHFKP